MKRWNGLRTRHERIPTRSGYILKRRRPISGFRSNSSNAASTASAKRFANSRALIGSSSVSSRYQRNCRSTSVSKRSDRSTLTSALETEPTACAYHLYGAGCVDCFDLRGPRLRVLASPAPDLASAVGKTFAAKHPVRPRWHYYKARSLLSVR